MISVENRKHDIDCRTKTRFAFRECLPFYANLECTVVDVWHHVFAFVSDLINEC
jgi:hypothetical protein